MKYIIIALVSLLLAVNALAAPYITLYPKDAKSHVWGPIEIVTCVDGDVVETDCGGQHTMYGAVIEIASGTITLPTLKEGMWACVKATSATIISIDVQATDHWELDGVTLTNGNKISSTGADDDTVCFYADSDGSVTTIHNPDSFVNGGAS